MATRAMVGGGAYLLDAVNNGETPKLSQLAKTMFFSGAPNPLPGASAVGNIAKGAASAGATVAVGNALEQSIEQDTMTPNWDEYKTSLKDAIVPAIIGSAALSVGGKLQSMQKVQAEADAGRAAAAELGSLLGGRIRRGEPAGARDIGDQVQDLGAVERIDHRAWARSCWRCAHSASA